MEGSGLPQEFRARMEQQLGHAYGAFLASYGQERTYGLRFNPLKIQKERLLSIFQEGHILLEPVAWAEEGFYYPKDARPGRHPLHEAGAYYIQEPSAMLPVALLDPQPGEKILDLCAAPGGKSTQIAGRMQGEGLLLSNEIIPSRAKALSQNIERMGVKNAVVLNETPAHLAERFPCFFDRILVDAPCSGEGMFRKDPDACGEWSLQQVEACAVRQREILSMAVRMLKPGGILVYSTCTFAPQEDEEMADWLTKSFPQFTLEKSMHIWPHLHRGEGHYAARFSKEGILEKEGDAHFARKSLTNADHRIQLLQDFLQDALNERGYSDIWDQVLAGRLAVFGEHLYLVPSGIHTIGDLEGLKTERAGLHLGCYKKMRFEPSHTFAMALSPDRAARILELQEPERYLRGESVSCGEQKGWTLATVQGCSIGWGKASQGVLKNHYPKGLRTAFVGRSFFG